jgi:hypothetical protein
VTDTLQFAAILLLIWVGVRLGLRPLIALRAQIDSRSAQDLAPLDETHVPGEVRPLTQALNRLFATVRSNAQSPAAVPGQCGAPAAHAAGRTADAAGTAASRSPTPRSCANA